MDDSNANTPTPNPSPPGGGGQVGSVVPPSPLRRGIEDGGKAANAASHLWPSLLLFILGFGADRVHKFLQVSAACFGGQCLPEAAFHVPATPLGWLGGEYVPVTNFFDYVLVWNTGISYGLLASVPVGLLGVLMIVAIVALAMWWWRADGGLVRAGLALCIGGALSNALDRLVYGAVADFFHFHYEQYSFYIFNLADAAITAGVVLLVVDFLVVGRRRNT